MNIPTPSTQDISDNIVAQLESSLTQAVPLLPKAFIRVLAKALSGVFILLWKYAGWSLLQMFVTYASDQDTVVNGRVVNPLKEWGRRIGVGDPEPAIQAEHVVLLPVTVQTGVLPIGSQFLFARSGVLYLSMAAVELNASTVRVRIKASSDQSGGDGSGAIGNLQVGDIVNLANPLPNVSNAAAVLSDSSSVAGADAESSNAYRARIISRWQQKPQGGAFADYVAWAQDLNGIIGVYPYTGATPNYVNVYVEATPESSGSADGIPSAGQLNSVFQLLQFDVDGLASRRPAGVFALALPISRQAFDVIVTGLSATDPVAAKASILEAVDQYLRSRKPFIVGVSLLPRQDRVTVAAVSGVIDDAINAAGGTVASVTLKKSGATIVAYTLGAGETAKLGAGSFI